MTTDRWTRTRLRQLGYTPNEALSQRNVTNMPSRQRKQMVNARRSIMEVLHHTFSSLEITVEGEVQDAERFLFRPQLATLVASMLHYWKLTYGAGHEASDPPSDDEHSMSSSGNGSADSADFAWQNFDTTVPDNLPPDADLFAEQINAFYDMFPWLKSNVESIGAPTHLLHEPDTFQIRCIDHPVICEYHYVHLTIRADACSAPMSKSFTAATYNPLDVAYHTLLIEIEADPDRDE